jgi:hypothetical protein
VFADRTLESGEWFAVNLSEPVNATIAVARGVGFILNDDTWAPVQGRVLAPHAQKTAGSAPGVQFMSAHVFFAKTAAVRSLIETTTVLSGTDGLRRGEV